MKNKYRDKKIGNLLSGFHTAVMGSKAYCKEDYCKEVEYKMETKSRYEVIAELEEKKRELIIEGDSLDQRLKAKEKELRDLKRKVEDKEDEIKDFKEAMKTNKETNKELIKSVDDSLKRFENLGNKERK